MHHSQISKHISWSFTYFSARSLYVSASKLATTTSSSNLNAAATFSYVWSNKLGVNTCSLAQKWQQTPIYKEMLLLLTGARFLQWPHLIEAQSRNQLTNNMITSKRKDHTNKNRNLTKGRCILTMVHKIQPKHLCFCPKLSHQNYQLLVPPHWMGLQLSSHWFL